MYRGFFAVMNYCSSEEEEIVIGGFNATDDDNENNHTKNEPITIGFDRREA